MSVDSFNDPDGRGKHPGDSIEIMVVNFEAEIKRLRAALEEISATFNKPFHLLKREPAMIAYAALKPQRREPNHDR